MATVVLTDVSFVANSVDLSNRVKSVTFHVEKEVLDDTAMGSTAHTKKLGLSDSNVQVTFFQDRASGSVDATLWSIWNTGTAVSIVGKPTSSAVGATNPSYTLSALLPAYDPISGEVGQLEEVSVQFEGTGAVTRATA